MCGHGPLGLRAGCTLGQVHACPWGGRVQVRLTAGGADLVLAESYTSLCNFLAQYMYRVSESTYIRRILVQGESRRVFSHPPSPKFNLGVRR